MGIGDDGTDTKDPKASRARRDKGMTDVKANSEPWWSNAILIGINLEDGWKGIGEDLRFIIRDRIGPPARYGIHHNIQGSLVNTLVSMGVLEPTGELRTMRAKKAHAKANSPVYIRTKHKPSWTAAPLQPSTTAAIDALKALVLPSEEPFASFMDD